jgi:hypothetical protein
MKFTMENLERLTLAQMQEFTGANRDVEFRLEGRTAAYGFIEAVLRAQRYRSLSKGQRGSVRGFLAKVTGFSRAQFTRLVSRWRRTRHVAGPRTYRPCFPRRYTAGDVALLAAVDAAHQDLSGPAARHILWREFHIFGQPEYQRLAGLSVSHLYNLRRSVGYRSHRVVVQHTQARRVSIAERRKPDPRSRRPGYLRVDTVHQGNRDGHPGLFHINAVDTVTQWQVVGCVQTIAESHLIPVLEAMLHQFPFRLLGFHCDNGSEFINHTVAKLLNKLLVEFTKSRPYRTTDNALVEGKNGAVIGKHMGYGALPAEHAEEFQKFYAAHFNPYLNYHRPRGFATLETGARGKRRRRYPAGDYRTPFEKLASLETWQQHLKEGISAEMLPQQAARISDTEAALRMQKAKLILLAKCRRSR